MYTNKFGVLDESTGAGSGGGKKKNGGVLEGIKLFIDHNYVKGIFFISCFFMIEVDAHSCTHMHTSAYAFAGSCTLTPSLTPVGHNP